MSISPKDIESILTVIVVEKSGIIDGSSVRIGDKLIGIASSGPHSNGYSLIRKIIDVSGDPLDSPFGDSTLGETLLAPTRIYVKPVLNIIKQFQVNALAHITGGGLLENIPRVLPRNTRAVIDTNSWEQPAIFDWLQQQGNVESREMYRTFNCGIGMVMAVSADEADSILDMLRQHGENATVIGSIEAADDDQERVELSGL
ncbi:phosphoribosylformylglycinamidine cyclo-ligase [Spongiibacter tropicus]|uniref:phosphoribosylformylglycinamidine cyclo-ligase n=1 Tax=Spongiibacter tropicus TaxID=454602 RepID=UPI0035BE555C